MRWIENLLFGSGGGSLGMGERLGKPSGHAFRPSVKPCPDGIVNRRKSSPPIFAAFSLGTFVLLAGWTCRAAAALEQEKALVARGEYPEAITRLKSVLAREPNNAPAAATLLEALIETGEYRQAAERSQEFLKRRNDPAVAGKAAEAACLLGEYDRAATLLETVSTPRAEWLRGSLADRKGQKPAARAAFEKVVSRLSQGSSLSAEDEGVAAASLAELKRFKEANDLYRDAVKRAPDDASLKAGWGRLLLEKHNPGEAEGLFREALEANPKHTGALVGLAELAAGEWDNKAADWLNQALQVNPNLAEARLILVQIHLQQEDYADAAKELDQALKVNPNLLEAWSLRAVSEYVQGNTQVAERDWIARILKENPSYGRVFADLADFLLLKRQYGPAVEFYRKALAMDPDLDDARSNLGINLFRLGKEQEARSVLEEAYRQDPYNVWTVNTLRLMDSFTRFDAFETPHFRVKLHKKESALLRAYVEELLERSLQTLTERYHYAPGQKVTFEMYPDHEDFAVRTLGMPGLGALGASFGSVVAMDSPSARKQGEFHWGSTLWHELTHVITLGITANRVPRWFTEGLSVYEETRARAGWGDPMTLTIVQALQQNKLIPLEDLNGAFVRPKYPTQIEVAYFQAGMACGFIADKHGFPKILAMLAAYGKGQNDAEVVQEVLGLSPAEFDTAFKAYAREHTNGFAQALNLEWAGADKTPEELRAEVEKNPGNYFARLHLAAALQKEKKFAEAISQAQAAQELFPSFTDGGNPYELLADAYEGLGRKDKAAGALLLWKERKGRNPKTFQRLATLLQDTGRTAEAIPVLQEALNVSMLDLDIHERLAESLAESAHPEAAVREYQAVLALDPPDKAEAHYRLAVAYQALSDVRSARQQVLAALEIAPGFRPAQKLLLELSANQ